METVFVTTPKPSTQQTCPVVPKVSEETKFKIRSRKMAATTVCLYLAVCVFAIASIESAVIKMQEIPLKPGVTMKIVIKDDPKHEGGVVASIKIAMDEKPKIGKDMLTKLINNYAKPATDFVPDFEDRTTFGKGSGNCSSGKVRRGPLCVNA